MTTLMRFDPFRDLQLLKDKMDRLFEDTFARTRGDEILPSTWAPSIDIYETENELVVEAEIPGVDKKDIKVDVTNNVLTVKGERKFSSETKEENYYRIERSYGSFSRSFTLPGGTDVDKISAEHKNGVLIIKLPKRPEAKPKSVEVKVG